MLAFMPVPQSDSFKTLATLVGGRWQMKAKKGFLCERWTTVNDHELMSQAYKLDGTGSKDLERVTLIQKGDDIFYVPVIKDQNQGKAVEFKLTKATKNQFEFTNPTHDFPQRIVYHIVSQDSVHAWIDGKFKGKFAKEDFYYTRVKD